MKFKHTDKLILSVLETVPATRNSDALLYLEVILPCFETVRRTRQKIQADRDDLRAVDKVQDYRAERELQFSKHFGAKCHDE